MNVSTEIKVSTPPEGNRKGGKAKICVYDDGPLRGGT